MKDYNQAQRAYDSMEEPCECHGTDAMDDCCERDYEPDDTDWDAIDFGPYYDGTGGGR
jgi:hypothetical protein